MTETPVHLATKTPRYHFAAKVEQGTDVQIVRRQDDVEYVLLMPLGISFIPRAHVRLVARSRAVGLVFFLYGVIDVLLAVFDDLSQCTVTNGNKCQRDRALRSAPSPSYLFHDVRGHIGDGDFGVGVSKVLQHVPYEG
jgi:hypothetical protein